MTGDLKRNIAIDACSCAISQVIKHWFRNTLFKERQRNKDSPYNFSVPPATTLNLDDYERTAPTARRAPPPADDAKSDPPPAKVVAAVALLLKVKVKVARTRL